jgi:hypothetical protein
MMGAYGCAGNMKEGATQAGMDTGVTTDRAKQNRFIILITLFGV